VFRVEDVERLIRLVLALTALLQAALSILARKRKQRERTYYRRKGDVIPDGTPPRE